MATERPATSDMPWSSLLGNIREYAIFTLDADGVIDSWNLGVSELFGFEEHEFVGRRGGLIFTPEDRAAGADLMELAVARQVGEAKDDRWHVRKDGSRFWANGIMHAVRDEEGALTGYLKILRDQTEKRAAEFRVEQQGRLIAAILDSLPGVFYMFDGQRYVRWNNEVERVTGYSPEELAAATPEMLVVESERVREHVDDVFRSGQMSLEGHLRAKDGTVIPYLFTSHRVVLGNKTYILGLGIENSEQVRARQLLERRAREQTAIAELAATTLTTTDVKRILDLAVRHVADTLGAERVRATEIADDAAGGDDPGGSGDAAPTPAGAIRAPIRGHQHTFGFIEALSPPGSTFGDEDAAFLGAVADLIAGAMEQHRLHQALEQRAETDDLTGLLKRVAFEHRLVEALARAERQETKVAILFLDLDRFKSVNDSYGHKTGDEVLRQVATRIREVVRSFDVVARRGGDEFVLFLPDIKANAEITHIAERLLESFETPFSIAGREHKVGATIGIAAYPDHGHDAEELLSAADSALYAGKARGRNGYHFFTPEAER